jgi:DNA-binding NarL/FixJ family response regulator
MAGAPGVPSLFNSDWPRRSTETPTKIATPWSRRWRGRQPGNPLGANRNFFEEREMQESEQERLSRRELEVLGHLQQGLTNRQIADQLYISTNTINKHVQQVLRKLQVRNRVQAALLAGSVGA